MRSRPAGPVHWTSTRSSTWVISIPVYCDKSYFLGPRDETKRTLRLAAGCDGALWQDGNLLGRVELSPQELRMADHRIDAMSGPWEPSQFRDMYADRVNDLIEAKKRDKQRCVRG
jgi:non-homologous end joining protein Ku